MKLFVTLILKNALNKDYYHRTRVCRDLCAFSGRQLQPTDNETRQIHFFNSSYDIELKKNQNPRRRRKDIYDRIHQLIDPIEGRPQSRTSHPINRPGQPTTDVHTSSTRRQTGPLVTHTFRKLHGEEQSS